MEYYNIKIKNWTQYNPRADLVAPTWLRFQNNFFGEGIFYSWTASEKLLWVYLLCEASKSRKSTQGSAVISTAHAAAVTAATEKKVIQTLEKMKQLQLVEVRSVQGLYASCTGPEQDLESSITNERTNVTNERTNERGERGRQDETEKPEQPGFALGAPPGSPPPRSHPLVRIWNEHRGTLPEVKAVSNTRRRHADARWREKPDESHWAGVVQRLAASAFCRGENERGWRADFDFLVRPDTHVRTVEGKYDNRAKEAQGRATNWNYIFGTESEGQRGAS